jgi:hypothetical protein
MLVTLRFKYPNRDYKSCFFYKKAKIFSKNHFLLYKRSPKGFKYGKQRVSFFKSFFEKKFLVDTKKLCFCNDCTFISTVTNLVDMYNLYSFDCEPNVNLYRVSFLKKVKIKFFI